MLTSALVEKRVVAAAMEADQVLAAVTGLRTPTSVTSSRSTRRARWSIDLRKAKGKTSLIRRLRYDKHGPVIELQDPFRRSSCSVSSTASGGGQAADKIDLEAIAREMQAKRDKLSNRNTGGSP